MHVYSQSTMSAGVLSMCVLLCATSVYAATLTGVVKMPKAPHAPARGSVVTIIVDDGSKKTHPDTTDLKGVYTFRGLPKGAHVAVTAQLTEDVALPGYAFVIVTRDPTKADIQLQPPINASGDDWREAGKATASLDPGGLPVVTVNLALAGVSPASIFQFVSGAREQSKEAFTRLNHLAMFDPSNSEAIFIGLKELEKRLESSQSIPTYAEVKPAVPGNFTETQYEQMLGFISSSNADLIRLPGMNEDLARRVQSYSGEFEGEVFPTQMVAEAPRPDNRS